MLALGHHYRTLTPQSWAVLISGFYGHLFVATALRHRIWLSVTARMDPKVKAAITAIPDHRRSAPPEL